MNSTERIIATIQGQPTDRRAVVLVLSLYGAGLTNCPLTKYYTDASSYITGQLAVRDKFQPDVIFAPFFLPLLGRAFGSEIRYFDNQPPNMIKPAFDNAADFLRMPMPDIDTEPHLLYLRESLRGLVAASKGEYPVAAISMTSMDIPTMIFGINLWLEILLFDPDNARHILTKIREFFLNWTNTLFADGAAFVAIPNAFANLRIITPKLLKEVALPELRETFPLCNGPLIIHHAGGYFQDMLPYLRGLPNVVGFCIGKHDNLVDSRSILGPDVVLLGNIDGPDLLGSDPAKVYQQTTSVLHDMQNDRKFILSSSAPDIDLLTPAENIMAIVQAVRDYRNGNNNAVSH